MAVPTLRRRLPSGTFEELPHLRGAFDPSAGPGTDFSAPTAPDFGPPAAPMSMDAFTPYREPTLSGTNEFQDYMDTGARLNAALTPQHVNPLRTVLGAFISARNPMLGSVITGDYQRMRQIQPLMQQHQLAEEQLKTGSELESADVLNRQRRATTDWIRHRPELEEAKLDAASQAKRNTVTQQFYAKGFEPVFDANDNIVDVKPLPSNMVPGSRKLVPDFDPVTRKPFYRILNHRMEEIGRLDVNAISQFMEHESQTSDIKQDVDGNWVMFPKTTVTSPVLPGAPGGRPAGAPTLGAFPSPTAAPPAAAAPPPNYGIPFGGGAGGGAAVPQAPAAPAAPRAGGTVPAAAPGTGVGGPRVIGQAKTPKMVVGRTADGVQVAGTHKELRDNGIDPSTITELPSGEIDKTIIARQLISPVGLFAQANRALAKFKPGELEGLSPRWFEFLAGTYGTADKRYIDLRTAVNGLLNTALMQAHVGATGRVAMMEKFQSLTDTGKMSKDTLKAALDSEREYVRGKAMLVPHKAATAPGGGTVPSFTDFVSTR